MTKEVYDSAVNALLDAYNNEELFHGRCDACAVGNIMNGNDVWAFATGCTGNDGVLSPYDESTYDRVYKVEAANILIDGSGLSKSEVIEIERAFEMAIHNTVEGYDYWKMTHVQKRGQYMGLVAVLDVMKDMVETEVKHKENITKLETIYANFTA